MKTYLLAAAGVLSFTVFSSCESNDPGLSREGLTDCPNGISRCDYLYTEGSSQDSLVRLQAGDQRVFIYTGFMEFTCGDSLDVFEQLWIMAPMAGDSFQLNDGQIWEGAVKYISVCACCNSVPFQPAGGKVVGEKAENGKWMIEAEVLLTSEGTGIIDTLQFRQYFVPGCGTT